MMSIVRPESQPSQPAPDRPARRRLGWLTARDRSWRFILLLCVVVFSVSVWQTAGQVDRTKYHPDESRWINRAHYIRDLLHPTSDAWADRYLTRGQPPMGSYFVGLGLLLQGRDVTTNGPWDFHYGDENNVNWNATFGNMPDREDLEAARRFNAVLGAFSCVFVLLIVTRLTNWVGGLAGGLFMAINPLQLTLSSQALADAPLVFIISLATLAVMLLADRPTWPRAILLGVLLGFGTSAKLSPIFIAVGLAGVGLLLLCDVLIRRIQFVGSVWGWVARGEPGKIHRLGWMLLAQPAIAFVTFVASYPYLWPDPFGRSKALYDFRTQEMESQARIWGDRDIDTRFEALRRVWSAFDGRYSSSARIVNWFGRNLGTGWGPNGFDGVLEVAGILLFIGLALRYGIISRHFMALAILGGQTALIIGGMRVDFNRYYLPILLFLAVCIGILAGQIWSLVPHLLPAHARARVPGRKSTVVSGQWPATTGQ